jgi:hypothetical protein
MPRRAGARGHLKRPDKEEPRFESCPSVRCFRENGNVVVDENCKILIAFVNSNDYNYALAQTILKIIMRY